MADSQMIASMSPCRPTHVLMLKLQHRRHHSVYGSRTRRFVEHVRNLVLLDTGEHTDFG